MRAMGAMHGTQAPLGQNVKPAAKPV
jgi:hypothetical protein